MKLTLLSTGYYHARWNQNLWLQWPKWREATLDDGFGWITEQHVREANRTVDAMVEKAGDNSWKAS